MGRNSTGESSDIEVRLDESAAAVEGYYAAYRDEQEVRDRLILEARDQGWAPTKVARWARVSPQRVIQIVAREGARAT